MDIKILSPRDIRRMYENRQISFATYQRCVDYFTRRAH